MKRAIVGLSCCVVAACSVRHADSNEASADAQPNTIVATTPVPGTAKPTAPAESGRLQAQVSSLSASTSGFSVRLSDTSTIVDLAADALFAFDSAELSPAATSSLVRTADLIRAGAPGNITVAGHADSKGDDAYNQQLSERRARAVANWMKGQVGVRLRSFIVIGKGETSPVAADTMPNGSDNPEGRAKNRRVEIIIPRR